MGYATIIYYFFIIFYAVFFMGGAIYGTFVPVYLDYIGYSKSEIGILMSLGPFVAIIAQPFWGITSDRARSKNFVLQILFLASIFTMALFPLSRNFYYLIAVITLFTFFQTSTGPISDAITLEYLSETNQKFGPIRMAGTIGYAVMSVIAGWFVQRYIGSIFILNIVVLFLAFMIVFKLPVVKGHQFGKEKVSIWKLFSDKNLVLLMVFNFLVQITLGFYYTYFPIYFRQIGGNNELLGWAYFISAMSEIPFLLYADKILEKIGTRGALIGASFVAAIRWLIISLFQNAYLVLPFQLLHGLIFIVLYYSMATYINQEVPKELRASGQTMNNLIGMGISRIVGSLLGGFLSDAYGIKAVFFYNSLLAFAIGLIFGYIFFRKIGR
ncbi:MFS transporter, PPP family, 3-phenylpropionic acid transporter [Thermoanaerobacter uzonensis DSM 18761]|uniref:MFS transporter, PPP family, 3-phenylpropionic acid transporter n=1 Tax=Thermoanaerobacter uzonensis DSM 18761 TaxID=1123369 RepID=A0A1M4XJ57_9THEO|nr:MFS transporter [Thermoanaerobacter uzonensis]SHE93202.1 MFS transporter, PPP family, 3-phenylpropionic acid transporter [Thermoanaerobacter uzonensis DSM 18761]